MSRRRQTRPDQTKAGDGPKTGSPEEMMEYDSCDGAEVGRCGYSADEAALYGQIMPRNWAFIMRGHLNYKMTRLAAEWRVNCGRE